MVFTFVSEFLVFPPLISIDHSFYRLFIWILNQDFINYLCKKYSHDNRYNNVNILNPTELYT